MFLLGDDFIRRERWERLVGQVHFEFGNGQEQRFWRADLSLFDIALTLGNDVFQQFAADGWLDRAFEIDRWEIQ
ncbi:hypothetical protein D3C75_1311240 [compost metagenome]